MNDSYDLYPREVILPDGVTPQELSEISIQNMRTSENVAIAVALKNLGYEIDTKGDGVSVVGLLDDSPVKDKLKKGDLLNSINNIEIFSATEFISTLRTYSIGENVSIGLLREVDGVKEVINEIEIGNRSSLKDYANDLWINTQARGFAAKTLGLDAIGYNFETINGKVFIAGITKNNDHVNKLIDSIKTIKGVKEIMYPWSKISIEDSKINLKKGTRLNENHFEYLRPCPKSALRPSDKKLLISKKLKKNIKYHEVILKKDVK